MGGECAGSPLALDFSEFQWFDLVKYSLDLRPTINT